ncbi:hypothetical protein [Pantoea sp.]|uniref:hypothetical protein n=1 Tax=Pantoea sp. TaxID=69393 RepID=UPI00289865A1|nr:hypothetical protein [Pantoea sp.]
MSKETMAFPGSGSKNDGMTLRDYLAAKAMASLLVDVTKAVEIAKKMEVPFDVYVSRTAYDIAATMLKVRARNS